MMEEEATLQLIDLPDIVLEMILGKLSYDEIAKNRIVCKTFDHISKKLLNRGFNLMEKYHAQCLRAIKTQLPRRESERRNHPLACHCDILTAIETRISMLSMTFTKYIDLNLCCFIPGKVIDEIFRVLRSVITQSIKASKISLRTPEILQELRDISSMAIEHFDEKILPDFKNSLCTSVSANVTSFKSRIISHSHSSSSQSSPLPHSLSPDKINETFKRIYSRTKKNKMTVLCVKGQMGKMKLRMNRQSFQMRLQSLKLQEHAKKIQDQDTQIADMRKHLEDYEQKLGDMTAELSRAREETQKSDSLESCKRKIADISVPCESTLIQAKELQAKKRKLIVERKSSSDAQDVKFKKFMSDLLGENMPSR